MNTTPVSLPTVLRLNGLKHRLTDKAKGEHFTVYVEKPLEFISRDFIGLLGPSGCGKTTLLTILGLLRSPTHLKELETFELFVPPTPRDKDWECVDLADAWRRRRIKLIDSLRRQHFGFALQSGELISSLTVRENIAMPLKVNYWSSGRANNRVEELISQFRLSRIQEDKAGHVETGGSSNVDERSEGNLAASSGFDHNALANSRINRLSGGEYQRVALARSIAHRPSVVFVDEPTSALNRELAYDALSVMRDLQRKRSQAGITFMITHDEKLAEEFCNVIVRMAPRKNEPAGEVVEVIRIVRAAKETGSEISQQGVRWQNAAGELPIHEELLTEPAHVEQHILRIPGVGPRKAAVLGEQLKVKNLEQLLAACEAGEVQQLRGFSAKTEQTILAGIAMLPKATKEGIDS